MDNTLKNLTIIIPTHCRHRYLPGIFSYYKKFPAQIICCDSTGNAYSGEVPDNVTYLHLNGMPFASKLLHSIRLARSDLVLVSADDTFITKGALGEGVEFLLSNPDYKLLRGMYVDYMPKFDGSFITSGISALFSVDEETPAARVSSLMARYFNLLWSLFEKETLRAAYEIINRARYNNDRFFELTIAMIAAARGKIRHVDGIWGARELNVNDNWGSRHKPLVHGLLDRAIREDLRTASGLIDREVYPGYTRYAFRKFIQKSFWLEAKGLVYRGAKKIPGLLPDRTGPAGMDTSLEGYSHFDGLEQIRIILENQENSRVSSGLR